MRMPAPDIDPRELAKYLGIPLSDVSLRLHVTRDWLRLLSLDPRHRSRVRCAVLELALERELS